MARVDLRFCVHALFGIGCIFAERQADAGNVLDIWFVADQKLRTMLAEHVTTADQPDKLSRELRAAFAEYKRGHKIGRARPAAEKRRVRRPFTDRPEWRRTFSFAGREDELAPVDVEEDVPADEAA